MYEVIKYYLLYSIVWVMKRFCYLYFKVSVIILNSSINKWHFSGINILRTNDDSVIQHVQIFHTLSF